MHPCSVHFRHRVLGALVSLLSAENRLAVLVETEVGDLDVAVVYSTNTVTEAVKNILNVQARLQNICFSVLRLTLIDISPNWHIRYVTYRM